MPLVYEELMVSEKTMKNPVGKKGPGHTRRVKGKEIPWPINV